MGKVVNKIPLVSQVKSLAQVIGGDAAGAKQTQEEFSKQTPIVSQIRSAVEAISGNADAARRTQNEFLNETLYNTPVISQGISAGYAIAGDSEEAKRIQQKFLDDNVRGVQELLSGSWLKQFGKLSTSRSLTDRSNWMSKYQSKKLTDMLIPGTHDTATYQFVDAAFVTNWAQAQQFSIYEQLKGGIRYLDIRVNTDKHNGEIYCSHTFYTIPFQDVLDDVSKFIRENTEEVIIFAVQGDGGSGQLSAAKSAAKTTLSGYLTDSITGAETLESLVSNNKNIIYAQDHSCGSLSVDNSWDDTRDANPIEAVNKCVTYGEARTRSTGKLILMALEATQFTGGTPGVIKSIIGELDSLGQGLEELAQYSNYATLNTFLKKSHAVAGSNVINIDFANDEIIGKVISMN